MPEVLPGYRYNQQTQRYTSQATGRFVARKDIVNLLDAQVRGNEERTANLVIAYHEQRISPSVFVEQMRTELKREHLQNRALGKGGWDRLTPADYGAVGGRLRADYRRLEGFASDIAEGKITLPQAINRSNMYVGNARVQYWEAQRETMQAQPGRAVLERRLLGAAEHCSSCVEYYAMGWQELGTLPPPGVDSECMTNCRCRMDYKEIDVLITGEYLNTRR